MVTFLPFLVVAIAVIVLIPLDPDVKVGDFEPTPYRGKINPSPNYLVQDHYFQSGDDNATCHAWLYLPLQLDDNNNDSTSTVTTTKNNSNRNIPVIIMASGFAEQKDFGFDVYAERFVVKHKMAVFLFDYRNFGASSGRPRNWVSPKRHLQDWDAAIDYIQQLNNISNDNDIDNNDMEQRQQPEGNNNHNENNYVTKRINIDPNKIGLWGMSFAGGHVLTIASTTRHNDSSVVAVVAQAPFLSQRKKSSSSRTKKQQQQRPRSSRVYKRKRLGKLRLVWAAIQDIARGYLGLPPVVIPILGIHGTNQLSMMPSTPQNMALYLNQQHPPEDEKLGGWQNQGPVRSLFELQQYNPLTVVGKSPPQIPILLVSGSRDSVCPSHLIEDVHTILPNSRIVTRNASHIEIMGPNHAPQVGEEMAHFFAETFDYSI